MPPNSGLVRLRNPIFTVDLAVTYPFNRRIIRDINA